MHGPRVLAAEIGLLAVGLSVVFGFGRLYDEPGWVVPLTLAVLATHGISAVIRRLRLGIAMQVLAVVVGMVLIVGWTLAPDTLRYGLPTSTTLDALGEALDEAIEDYPEARAPTEPTDGFILASMAGLVLVGLMANIAAFSLRAPLQALVPPFTLFTLCSLLGGGDRRIGAALTFIVASLAFMLAMRSIDAVTSTTWLPGDDRRGPDALVRLGGALIALTAVVAAIIGPALPGAADEGLWSWRGGGGGAGTRQIVSPLVDIRARLVNQSPDVAFTVESAEPSYWRMMSLDEFDGQKWRISSNFRRVSGALGQRTPLGEESVINQEFEILALSSEYLPAAFEPIAIEAERGEVTWDDRSATLLLDQRAREGYRYSVQSLLPDHSAESLRAADEGPPRALAERYLQLPELDARVTALAEEVTADAPTRYDQALALQMFFRDEFDYSLEIPEGSTEDQIVAFLFDRRAGYCEQFAASFAAMARTIGLPARVAVGFTAGEQSRTRPEQFTVRGGDSHAWPEVWFSGVGWVPFEPTPGRVAPGSVAWTELEETAAASEEEPTATTVPNGGPTPTMPLDLQDLVPEGDLGDGGFEAAEDTSVHPALVVFGAVVLAALAWAALITGLVALRRGRRRRRATDPSARIGVAWTEAVEALARRGRLPRAAETFQEYARRVAPVSPSTTEDLHELAQLTTGARFSARPASTDEVDRASELSHRVVRATIDRQPWWRRVLRYADPRVLLPTRPRRGRQHATVLSTT